MALPLTMLLPSGPMTASNTVPPPGLTLRPPTPNVGSSSPLARYRAKTRKSDVIGPAKNVRAESPATRILPSGKTPTDSAYSFEAQPSKSVRTMPSSPNADAAAIGAEASHDRVDRPAGRVVAADVPVAGVRGCCRRAAARQPNRDSHPRCPRSGSPCRRHRSWCRGGRWHRDGRLSGGTGPGTSPDRSRRRRSRSFRPAVSRRRRRASPPLWSMSTFPPSPNM